MMTGDGDKHSYKGNGFDGGSRFRADMEYELTSSTDNLGDMTVVRPRYDF